MAKSAPASGSVVIAGQTMRYTLTATVTGSATTAATVLTDTLGANLTFGSVTAPGAFTAGGAGQVRTFTLPSGTASGTYSVTYTATVNAGATGSVNNAVTGAPCTTVGGCTTTNPIGNVTVSKALTAESGTQAGIAEAGETLTYTITLSNPSTVAVTNYALTDVLSAGLSYVSSTSGGANAGQTTNWTGLAVPASGTLQVTVVARVNTPIASTSVSNLAKPTGGQDPVCPSGACVVTPTSGNVALVKTLFAETGTQPGIAEAGETLTYHITLSNSGGTAVTNYNLTDTLSAGLIYVSSSNAGVNAGQTTNWTNLTVPANGSLIVSVVSSVASPITTANVTNLAKPTGTPDPNCPSAGCVTTPTAGNVTLVKSLVSESGSQPGFAEAGETLTYRITLTNTGGSAIANYALTDTLSAGLSYVSSTSGGVNSGASTNWSNLSIPANGSLAVTIVAVVNTPITTATVRNLAKPTGTSDPQCPGSACVETPTAPSVTALKLLTAESGKQPRVAEAGETLTYTIALTNSGGSPFNNYRFTENVPVGATVLSISGAAGFSGPVTGAAALNLTVPQVPARGSASVTVAFRVAAAMPAGVTNLVNLINGGDIDPNCGPACVVTVPVELPSQLSIIKTTSVREARIGDLVRYSVLVSNVGASNVLNATITDTPPPGFTYVAGSMSVVDTDGAFTLAASQYPLRIGGIDVVSGKQATITYLLRVGAGVRQGVSTNTAQASNASGTPISNIATAQVQIVSDPLVDESLILGTVFDDRDGDGWQDPANLSGVRVQGGFAPDQYVPDSTTVDRGRGPKPEPDASAPMLHGLNLGAISGRQSEADPVANHQVVIRQRLREATFTDDFVLTNDQGVTVRMNAAGKTTVERTGDAAKGLNGADPLVERRVAPTDGGYLVEYVIQNMGIDERGIPGVRIASVEGLLMETDQFGRYHVTGIQSGDWNRGRNFVLKIDPSTLPPGAELTTANPLVRRITPGMPARFDFGVKLPSGVIGGGVEQVTIELGEVLFTAGSSELRAEFRPVLDKIAAQVIEHRGGDLVISATGETQALALSRVQAVRSGLEPLVPAAIVQALRVTSRLDLTAPETTVVGAKSDYILLGTVLFDTDKSIVKPAFRPLLAKVAQALNETGGGRIGLVGHADRRASADYNLALGLRRAKAVYDALREELSPDVRAKVRVETLFEPAVSQPRSADNANKP